MPQSLSNVVVHLVFSTKNRTPNLTPEIRYELHPYLAGVLRNAGCVPVQIGGVEDHVHLLFRASRTLTLAQIVEKLKTSSAKWLKTKGRRDFTWQGGYGAFSVSPNLVGPVAEYIRDQEAHHRKVTFQDELRALLKEARVEPDERYLWD
jgi:putative transposase